MIITETQSKRGTEDAEEKKKRRRWLLLLLLLLLLLFLTGAGFWYFYGHRAGQAGGGNVGLISYDSAAENGNLPGKSDAEIQADLNAIVEAGMFNISIAPEIDFASPDAEGQARIENIKANHYLMQVTITLDDTGEIVYTSGAIRPEQYIENIRLSAPLKPGTYPATATFAALNPESGQKEGQAGAQIILKIGS